MVYDFLRRTFYGHWKTKITNKISLACSFAMKKHEHQKRKDCKTEYYHHLEDVVENLQKLGIKDQNVLCAGWLHDTIEDTDTDFDDIEELFGKITAKIVSQVSKDTRIPQKQRESQYLLQLKHASWQSKAVKLGDLVANIADLKESGYTNQKKLKQVKDKLKYLSAIKPGLVKNKSKLPGLQKIETQLNDSLVQYRQKKINFS